MLEWEQFYVPHLKSMKKNVSNGSRLTKFSNIPFIELLFFEPFYIKFSVFLKLTILTTENDAKCYCLYIRAFFMIFAICDI